jgi:hypothetical protein
VSDLFGELLCLAGIDTKFIYSTNTQKDTFLKDVNISWTPLASTAPVKWSMTLPNVGIDKSELITTLRQWTTEGSVGIIAVPTWQKLLHTNLLRLTHNPMLA